MKSGKGLLILAEPDKADSKEPEVDESESNDSDDSKMIDAAADVRKALKSGDDEDLAMALQAFLACCD